MATLSFGEGLGVMRLGRSFFSGKKYNSISKGFPLSSGLQIGKANFSGFYDLKKEVNSVILNKMEFFVLKSP
ncbi:hypothetical protein [Flavobacterium sp. ZB4R12]|uniref:hypothetical protein n=1 Tax=Flavobacterium sp. ZB4R12 TaxID=3398732 RepID=UPI003AAF02F2